MKFRSPFRYPGGKTWFLPILDRWMRVGKRPGLFVEPFAGGGSCGLHVAFENLANRVIMAETDPLVASVWITVLSDDAERLAKRVLRFDFNARSVNRMIASNPISIPDRAFRAVILNRARHGGLMTAGAGIMTAGENGKGLSSRWYPETLHDRIMAIHGIRDRIEFHCGDGMRIMSENRENPDARFFVDPPYSAGVRLYDHHTVDMDELFLMIGRVKGDFLMTLESGMRERVVQNGLKFAELNMIDRMNRKREELLVSGKSLKAILT